MLLTIEQVIVLRIVIIFSGSKYIVPVELADATKTLFSQ
ncbi:hypothetical Protein YC6258_03976 [Gynuella sunshinyii YC6258]|uniref:Uncharacterized protein n=1 Tax=Gynuella sunshinyii YC6258 TaxID=1445510 RepID=A0A0C5VMQ7_9GAMM|nr:hypothetical Protein YC6258_03976 [Gynuella sunshinyii YC6258]